LTRSEARKRTKKTIVNPIPLTVAICLVTRFTEASTKRTVVTAARPSGSS
jgi:hypothetical protein